MEVLQEADGEGWPELVNSIPFATISPAPGKPNCDQGSLASEEAKQTEAGEGGKAGSDEERTKREQESKLSVGQANVVVPVSDGRDEEEEKGKAEKEEKLTEQGAREGAEGDRGLGVGGAAPSEEAEETSKNYDAARKVPMDTESSVGRPPKTTEEDREPVAVTEAEETEAETSARRPPAEAGAEAEDLDRAALEEVETSVRPTAEAAAEVPTAEVRAEEDLSGTTQPSYNRGWELWVAQRADWLGVPPEEIGRHRAPARGAERPGGLEQRRELGELSLAERVNLRGCLAATGGPYPTLRRQLPLALAVRCAHELWHEKSGAMCQDGSIPGSPVEKIAEAAEAARASTQDFVEKSVALGSNIARWGQCIVESAVSAFDDPRRSSSQEGITRDMSSPSHIASLRTRGGLTPRVGLGVSCCQVPAPQEEEALETTASFHLPNEGNTVDIDVDPTQEA